jgi:hypothetical protein
MNIIDYVNFIRHFPYKQQAFRVNKNVWLPDDGKKRIINQLDRIKSVFGKEDSAMISRNDLLTAKDELELFVIKVLMWGYPTKGRGNNIEKILNPENFDQTIKKLKAVRQNGNISNQEVEALFSDGLGLSTVSKILYFLQIKIDSSPALILDLRVIEALTRKDGFEDDELKNLKKLNYNNAPKKYTEYLKAMQSLASKMTVQPEQIEMFLFEFGSNLKGI